MQFRILAAFFLSITYAGIVAPAAIERPDDAPQPMSPSESVRAFEAPSGMSIRLLASEPLINEPSGVCWDEHGRLFVSELHGYNLEGQIEIDKLNETGELDTEVRRVHASETSKLEALAQTSGSIKLLLDTDGDGQMDHAEIWADDLPPCYGIVPANGGIIAACAPEIVFLKDTDGDNRPDIRATLFTGFKTGMLERGINAPTWGPDGWIYFGQGWPGSEVTGPRLKRPVVLPATDFRIRADGSAIEPVSGGGHTFGMAFTAGGNRFVTNTTHPGLFVTPIPWRYLSRNPDAPAPQLVEKAGEYTQVYPIAEPHPWRVKREGNAEYFAFYRKVSISDSVASGYFTSVCGPLVYQDSTLPGLQGDYLVCEPAQNLIHRAIIVEEGAGLRLERKSGEETREFLASRDSWFHPISLAHTPEGNILIVDFYREIIEDYSAIPRHLQQQYGVVNGRDRGRLWLLTTDEEDDQSVFPSPNMAILDDTGLMGELDSPIYWRRQTARRLLLEQGILEDDYPLQGWRNTSDPSARISALRVADLDRFSSPASKTIERDLINLNLGSNPTPRLLLQAALSLGQSAKPEAIPALIEMARTNGSVRWMDSAIASSSAGHERRILLSLAGDPGKSEPVMANLAGIIANRQDQAEIIDCIQQLETANFSGKPLEILRLGIENEDPLGEPIEAAIPALPSVEQRAALEEKNLAVIAALDKPPDLDEGRAYFTAFCSSCHRSKGIGSTTGPDLDAEFQRASETIARDILFPSESSRPGYETVLASPRDGEILAGIAASESPTSITLRLPGGVERTLLRNRARIWKPRGNPSLMPLEIGLSLEPEQIANIIAFLRQAPSP